PRGRAVRHLRAPPAVDAARPHVPVAGERAQPDRLRGLGQAGSPVHRYVVGGPGPPHPRSNGSDRVPRHGRLSRGRRCSPDRPCGIGSRVRHRGGSMRSVLGVWRLHRRAPVAGPVLGIAVAAVLASGCATGNGPLPEAPQAVPYRVGPSDELVIRVLPDPAIEREVIVQPDGTFAFDLVGEVTATGRTPAEI